MVVDGAAGTMTGSLRGNPASWRRGTYTKVLDPAAPKAAAAGG